MSPIFAYVHCCSHGVEKKNRRNGNKRGLFLLLFLLAGNADSFFLLFLLGKKGNFLKLSPFAQRDDFFLHLDIIQVPSTFPLLLFSHGSVSFYIYISLLKRRNAGLVALRGQI